MERISKYKTVVNKISQILLSKNNSKYCKLLVVTKKRPIEQILEIYNEGHRDFGENYVHEIIEKCEKLPNDINWHFIGHLQSNKCKKLISSVKNLKVVESIDSFSLAEELNKQCLKLGTDGLKIYIQINISEEKTKSGVNKEEVVDLYEKISKTCEKIQVAGIMSLGDIGNVQQFNEMMKIKLEICEKFTIDSNNFQISMGTSDDYEEAIKCGSNEIRVGGLIFDI
jgi:pyridoxal phosphate enzyme (YggS family)